MFIIILQEGVSLLMEACRSGRLHAVNILLKNGATVDLKDQVESFFLWFSVHGLSCHGVCPTQEGSTAVMVAAAQGHAPIVEQLINAGGNPNPHTTVDQSIMHC